MKSNRRSMSQQTLQARDELTWVVMLPSSSTRRVHTVERRSPFKEHLYVFGLAVLLVSFGVALGSLLGGIGA